MTTRKLTHRELSQSLREWIGITVSVVAVLISLVAFRDVASANDNIRKAEAARLLDEAGDLLGGSQGVTVLFDLPTEAGILEQANRKIRDALVKDPKNPRGFRYQATYFRATGRLDQAAQQIQRAITLTSDDPVERTRNYIAYGVILGDAGQVDAALKAFAQAQSIDPADPIVFYDLAIAYHAQKRDGESDRAYSEAIRLTAKRRGFPVSAAQRIPPSKRKKLMAYFEELFIE